MRRRLLPLLLALALLLPALPAARVGAADGADATAVCAALPDGLTEVDPLPFQLICRRQTGQELASLTFTDTLPIQAGELRCQWAVGQQRVSSGVTLYADGSPLLSSLTFRSAETFSGTVEVAFTGKSAGGRVFSGKLLLSAPERADLICREELDPAALNDLCRARTGSPLRLIRFDAPTAGQLRYPNEWGGISSATGVTFYADSGEGLSLSRVYLQPPASETPHLYIPFTAEARSGKQFQGRIQVTFATGDRGSARYVLLGEPAPVDLPGQSCTAALPDAGTGCLWLNYGTEEARQVLPDETLTATSGPLTFVPAGTSMATVELEFSLPDGAGGDRCSLLRLQYRPARNAAPFRVPVRDGEVSLSWALAQACGARELDGIQSVSFPTLPEADWGVLLYEGTPVSAGESCPCDGELTFLPGADFPGELALPYDGVDHSGLTFTGTLTLSTAGGAEGGSRFEDLSGWGWAAPAAEVLASFDGLAPSGQQGSLFRPGDNATRIDVFYAIYALSYSDIQVAPGRYPGFFDLPEDPLEANAASVLFFQGVAQGDHEGYLHPQDPVTRQDALVLCWRAMTEQGRLRTVEPGDLSVFSDADQLASYARDAAAELLGCGVLLGSDTGLLDPLSPITRAEMAALIVRAFS